MVEAIVITALVLMVLAIVLVCIPIPDIEHDERDETKGGPGLGGT